MRRVRVTTVAVEKAISNIYSESVVLALRISYPACRARAPCFFFVNCDASGFSMFFHIHHVSGIMYHKHHDIQGKKVLNMNCLFRFSLQLIF